MLHHFDVVVAVLQVELTLGVVRRHRNLEQSMKASQRLLLVAPGRAAWYRSGIIGLGKYGEINPINVCKFPQS